ncbi:uncharacterized protein C8R40DRAFT_74349 [Lentinula edodes]|uniref:uncharacterized protein n=1 Tax=Lentinula edodes TaxID=5353 RepID=UPI001E8EA53A|nr:uncharacterized protein C8R40DRAFT_74349 [Lentinula edodes]KAH7877417.1 hypothetical protein C8R40DRAFT_74349 [Lentinula edodes]
MDSKVVIIVHIRYSQRKAFSILDSSRKTRYDNLRLDLSKIKLPHPPEANVSEPSINEWSFYWETKKYGPLWNILESIVCRQKSDPMTITGMRETEIEDIWMEELPESPLTRRTRSPEPMSRRTRSRSQPRKSSYSRPWMNSRSRNIDSKNSDRGSAQRGPGWHYQNKQQNTPLRRSRNPRPQDSLSNSTSPYHSYYISDSLRQIDSVQTVLLEIEKAQQQSLDNNKDGESFVSLPLPPPHWSLPKNPSTPLSLTSESDEVPRVESFSSSPPNSNLFENPTHNSSDANSGKVILPQPVPSVDEEIYHELDEPTTISRNIADQRISDLTREFWDARRQLSALSARCFTIESQMKALNAFSLASRGNEYIHQDLAEAEQVLKNEREQREHAEMVLGDVLRECKQPTITPALLAALGQTEFSQTLHYD